MRDVVVHERLDGLQVSWQEGWPIGKLVLVFSFALLPLAGPFAYIIVLLGLLLVSFAVPGILDGLPTGTGLWLIVPTLVMTPFGIMLPFAFLSMGRGLRREVRLSAHELTVGDTIWNVSEQTCSVALVRKTRSGCQTLARHALPNTAVVPTSVEDGAGWWHGLPTYGVDVEIDGQRIKVTRRVTEEQAHAILVALARRWPPTADEQHVDEEALAQLGPLLRRT